MYAAAKSLAGENMEDTGMLCESCINICHSYGRSELVSRVTVAVHVFIGNIKALFSIRNVYLVAG